MTGDDRVRWQRIRAILDHALAVPEEDRAGLIDRACEGNPDLGAEVLSLLDASGGEGDVIGRLSLALDTERPSFEAAETERLNAALEGRYRVERELGEGGMASVYLAADLKHRRKVALKVLKPELAAVVGADRFLAEIRTTANLQHPHILPLFDSGQADGLLFYVMPYVEGESLRDRLDREVQLPVGEAVGIATKLASALEAAHEQGVIHRDVKPGNVLLSRGEPLLSDFGIALAVTTAGGQERLTETGLSVGTPQYMSPEQATGDFAVGPASDVYSLGCVLYETLVGEPPYTGRTHQAILGKLVAAEPSRVSDRRKAAPPNVDAAVTRALEKVPADRFGAAGDFARALGDRHFRHGLGVGEASRARWRRLALGSAATTMLLVLVVVGRLLAPGAPGTPPTRSLIELGRISVEGRSEIIVSPDGSRFAVTGAVDGQTALYWRRSAEQDFRLIPGTEGAVQASFSPDAEWIAYSTLDGALHRIALSGGAPTALVADGSVVARSPHWGEDGNIVFGGPQGVHLVSELGGEPTPLGLSVMSPSLLPGSGAILAARAGGDVVLFEFGDSSPRVLAPGGFDPQYVDTGHILYVDAAGGLWALPFDENGLEARGDPVPVLSGLTVWYEDGIRPYSRFSASRNGTLVYQTGRGSAAVGDDPRELVFVARDGRNLDRLGLDPAVFFDLRLSPDGRFVVYNTLDGRGAGPHLYVFDIERGTSPRQLTFEGSNQRPVWSPDGSRIAFASLRDGSDGWDLFLKNVVDNSAPGSIVTSPGGQWPSDWPAEDSLVLTHSEPGADSSRALARQVVRIADLSGESVVVRPYVSVGNGVDFASVSPAGDLAAYQTLERGVVGVYMSSFPEADARERVSEGEGHTPSWSRDGSTLFYWTGWPGPVTSLMAASVEVGPPFVVTARDTLFSGAYVPWLTVLHPDQERWLAAQPPPPGSVLDGGPSRFLVVVNWFAELRERTGG